MSAVYRAALEDFLAVLAGSIVCLLPGLGTPVYYSTSFPFVVVLLLSHVLVSVQFLCLYCSFQMHAIYVHGI